MVAKQLTFALVWCLTVVGPVRELKAGSNIVEWQQLKSTSGLRQEQSYFCLSNWFNKTYNEVDCINIGLRASADSYCES